MRQMITKSKGIQVLLFVFGAITFMGEGTQSEAGAISAAQRRDRLSHAKEIMGASYKKSVVKFGESVPKVNETIYAWTLESLPKKYKGQSKRIAQAIIDEAHRNGLDPIFLMSVIQTESTFNPDTVGGVGELGLMQIRPETGKWIAGKIKFAWKGDRTLKDPVLNIRLGAAHFAWLRDHFDMHAQLYVAAYNMGQGNVKKLLREDKMPKEYPSRVVNNYIAYYSELKEMRVERNIAGNRLPPKKQVARAN